MAPQYNFGMNRTRKQILPLAETALREAVRHAVREALLEVSREESVRSALGELPARTRRVAEPGGAMRLGALSSRVFPKPDARVPFGELSDEEAWEEFEAIRFTRYAGTGG
jgi:hypothetical protein